VELARLSAETPPARPSAAGEDSSAPPVLRLYGQHCAACHGPDGNGDGRAARHLFPRPLNLRADRMRLVGTLNGVPTVEDIEQVIRQGVPGTAMPAFAELSADERRQLALQVQRFRREGIREQLLARISIQGDTIDDAELHRLVTGLSTPGAVLHVPAIGSASAESIARGRNHYANVGCRQCHGDDGTGATELLVFDEVGQPAFPRDLVHDPMKGGTSGESLYSRIRLGMPGTPHPAVTSLSESELIDLVQFCRSLSQSPHPHLTNYQRALQAARRASAAHLTPMAAPPATE
jgi:mono/diheme cytochrome c family protein